MRIDEKTAMQIFGFWLPGGDTRLHRSVCKLVREHGSLAGEGSLLHETPANYGGLDRMPELSGKEAKNGGRNRTRTYDLCRVKAAL